MLQPTDPNYASTPLTCATPAEQATEECSFEALKDAERRLRGRATAARSTSSGRSRSPATRSTRPRPCTTRDRRRRSGRGGRSGSTSRGDGSGTFSDVTTRLQGRQLAIVVDDQVVSAPTVQSPITNGSGVITGSFTEARAKDLATQLNAGALPVELTTQQVLTVSPTLGDESLQQGLVAGDRGARSCSSPTSSSTTGSSRRGVGRDDRSGRSSRSG